MIYQSCQQKSIRKLLLSEVALTWFYSFGDDLQFSAFHCWIERKMGSFDDNPFPLTALSPIYLNDHLEAT